MSIRGAVRASLKKVGMKPIGLQMTRSISPTEVKRFTLMEHLDDRISATVAQIEWQCMGFYCHVQVVEKAKVYYIWVGPKGRKILPRTLADEKIKRIKGHVPRVRR